MDSPIGLSLQSTCCGPDRRRKTGKSKAVGSTGLPRLALKK